MLRKEIIIKNASGDNQQLSEQELSDLVVSAVGVMSVEDKPTLVSLLQKSGSLVTDLNTQGEILDATFKAIRDSQQFRNDLYDYLVEQGSLANLGEQASMDGGYSNTTGAGKLLSSMFTKENIALLTSSAIGFLGASLQAKANKGQGQQAIDYTNAQANLEALKLKQLQALQSGSGSSGSGGTPPPSENKPKPKWVKPVLIGVGVLVLGLTIYFVAKKKK
jgi:hypothetical protein